MTRVGVRTPVTAKDAVSIWEAANDPTKYLHLEGDACAAVRNLPAGVRHLSFSSCAGLYALPRLPAGLATRWCAAAVRTCARCLI